MRDRPTYSRGEWIWFWIVVILWSLLLLGNYAGTSWQPLLQSSIKKLDSTLQAVCNSRARQSDVPFLHYGISDCRAENRILDNRFLRFTSYHFDAPRDDDLLLGRIRPS